MLRRGTRRDSACEGSGTAVRSGAGSRRRGRSRGSRRNAPGRTFVRVGYDPPAPPRAGGGCTKTAPRRAQERGASVLRSRHAVGGLDRLHLRDLERVQLAVLIPERDVFAGLEPVRAEPVAGFVVVARVLVVVDQPCRAPCAARAVHEAAVEVGLPGPESPHAALGALAAPLLRVEQSVGVQGSGHLVAVPGATVGVFPAAGQFQSNAMQHWVPPWMRMRKAGLGPSSEITTKPSLFFDVDQGS